MSNTSTTDKVVVGGALVGGLLFFGFLTNTCTSPFSKGDAIVGNDSKDTPAAIIQGGTSNNDDRVADLQTQMNALKLKNAGLTELEKDNEALRAAIVGKTKSHGEAKNLWDAQLRKLQNQLNNSNESTNKLQEKLAAMSSKGSTGLEGKINELSGELELSKTKNKDLRKQIEAMSVAPAASPNTAIPAKMEVLNGTIKDLKSKNNALTADVKKLNAQIKMTGTRDNKGNAAMKARITKLSETLADKDAQANKLKAQINQLKASKNIFVKSTDDLPKTAQTLFADLKTLEGKSAEEVKTAYQQITKKNNSEDKARIRFRSGKSNLTDAEKTKIANLTQAAGENSYFLIVGYADKTGSAAANQKLSSARSISVAKELASKAKGFQAAQAVYLGQTDRFGPASENRVVEIWEIK